MWISVSTLLMRPRKAKPPATVPREAIQVGAAGVGFDAEEWNGDVVRGPRFPEPGAPHLIVDHAHSNGERRESSGARVRELS